MVDYWLDSSVFIAGRDGPYGFDLAPYFWTVLEEMSDRDQMACPEMVYDELLDVPDDLADWVKERKEAGMFIDSDTAVQRELQRVSTYVVGRYPDNQPRRRFLDRADPWIIAHAIAEGGSVVTHEQNDPEGSSKVKIPNVCEYFEVRCIDVYQMLREQGVAWTS